MTTRSWHEDDNFWDGFGSRVFHEGRWKEAALEMETLCRFLRIPEGSRILDLCCGPGRHALELSRMGHQVTGVDRTPSYIESARERSRDQNLKVDWACDDMRTFSRPNAFDYIFNLMTSFGYFDDPADDLKVFEQVHLSLVSGGTFVLDLNSIESLHRMTFPIINEKVLPDGTTFTDRNTLESGGKVIRGEWSRVKDGKEEKFVSRRRLFSEGDLRDLFAVTGFVEVRSFGSFAGAPFDENAERLMLVGKRSEQG